MGLSWNPHLLQLHGDNYRIIGTMHVKLGKDSKVTHFHAMKACGEYRYSFTHS